MTDDGKTSLPATTSSLPRKIISSLRRFCLNITVKPLFCSCWGGSQPKQRTEIMYLSNNDLQNVARNIQINFSDGSLHSRSRVWEIFPIVVDELADMGYPQSVYTRKSLVLAICKMAKAMWIGQIQAHQMRRGA